MMLSKWESVGIAKDVAKGDKQIEIADKWGVSANTVANVKRRQSALIERESARYIEALPDAVEAQLLLVKALREDLTAPKYELDVETGGLIDRVPMSVSDPTRYNSAVKATSELMKASGLQPSQSTSLSVQAIYQDNRTSVIAPEVSEVLARLFAPRDPTEPTETGECEVVDNL